jgi:CRP/FNR family transcriptional regulator
MDAIPPNLLRTIPLFCTLEPEELDTIAAIVDVRRYPRGRVILHENDTPHYMYIVLSGKVRVVQRGNDGTEHMLAIHRKGSFFGEMALLDGNTSPATVIAHEDVRIGLISRSDFQKQILSNETILRQIIAILCGRLREAWLVLKAVRFGSAELRLRGILKNLASQHGTADARGTIITLKLTHRTLADYASVSRETASRLLSRLAGEGEIEVLEGRTILLTPTFLEKPPFL